MIKIKSPSELKNDNDKCLLKKCEVCHQDIATKTKITLAARKIWLCKECFKIVEF